MNRSRRITARCLLVLALSAIVLPIGASSARGTIGSGRGPGAMRGFDRPAQATTYVAPVPTPMTVLRLFDPPANPYGPGHRGVDLAVAAGQPVRAPADGVITFAGQVAGRGVIVVMHPDGISTEYEPVAPQVHPGDIVRRGDVLGRLSGTDTGCGRANCLHWGARRDGVYLDPLLLLEPLGPVRLLPWFASGTA